MIKVLYSIKFTTKMAKVNRMGKNGHFFNQVFKKCTKFNKKKQIFKNSVMLKAFQEIKMVEYNSIWMTGDIFCQICNKKRKGVLLQNTKMMELDVSLDLCPNCIANIAEKTKEFSIA